MSARSTALSALIACRKTNAWSDGVLKEYIRRDHLDSRDAALASRLCYGVVQNRMLLDFYLSKFVNGPLRRLQPVVLDILRLGAYQITMMDRIPDSAAVNESVELGKKYANHKAAGLINGVLRAMVRAEGKMPTPGTLDVRYSHPSELVELLRESVGDALLEPLLQSDNEAPKTVVQVNTLKITDHALRSHWEERGITYERHPWMPGCYLLSGFGSMEALDCFRNGSIYVQDAAARLAVAVMGLKPGMRVLDCCAAPGGKSFAAAMELENRGDLTSCDIHEHKLALIEKGAARLGVSILKTALCDASLNQPQWNDSMDAVIADVPCSGLGVIRKKPDIRYKDLTPLEALPAVQARILENAARYVRPGGTLLYSTCTILKRENEQVVRAFLSNHGEFQLEPMELPAGLDLENNGMITLLPCLHECDGFFIAKLRRLS
jgi:16S rRNA (cytosine967-C5)-methyltransferase